MPKYLCLASRELLWLVAVSVRARVSCADPGTLFPGRSVDRIQDLGGVGTLSDTGSPITCDHDDCRRQRVRFQASQMALTGGLPDAATPGPRCGELRAMWPRTVGIAATGAVAVFGSVAIQGAHADLQRGLDQSARDVSRAADVWVFPPGLSNLLATAPIREGAAGTLARLPGVKAVSVYRGGFLDYGDRRLFASALDTVLIIIAAISASPTSAASAVLILPLSIALSESFGWFYANAQRTARGVSE
jgi:hypothetical protein